MVASSLLKLVIADQREASNLPADYYPRYQDERLSQLADNKEIIVLTGVRRCGKSILMQYLRSRLNERDYYFNFEDERLVILLWMIFNKLFLQKRMSPYTCLK